MIQIVFSIIGSLSMFLFVLGKIDNQHWVFRTIDFIKIQITVLLSISIALGITAFVFDANVYVILLTILLIAALMENAIILFPFLKKKKFQDYSNSKTISILSVNVEQDNSQYEKLTTLIEEVNPDIFLTYESNSDWEKALNKIQIDYPFSKGIALENTYGMHFYSKIKCQNIQINYLTSDEIPSIEAVLELDNNQIIHLFGIHPPPPSPTEEETSKVRDSELLSIGKRIEKLKKPTLVIGDFNNVSWAKSTVLFKKMTGFTDARIGRGFICTFHARYRLFRFPIDLIYHNDKIAVVAVERLKYIGSDHFPVLCSIQVVPQNNEEKEKPLDSDEKDEVDELIEDGKKESLSN